MPSCATAAVFSVKKIFSWKRGMTPSDRASRRRWCVRCAGRPVADDPLSGPRDREVATACNGVSPWRQHSNCERGPQAEALLGRLPGGTSPKQPTEPVDRGRSGDIQPLCRRNRRELDNVRRYQLKGVVVCRPSMWFACGTGRKRGQSSTRKRHPASDEAVFASQKTLK